MLARIADDLRWCIKAHWLRVQKRAGKDRRIMTFQPGRHINQMGKTGGMTFREAIIAKALDLIETAGCKLVAIAARHHAPNHFVFQRADGATAAESGHGFS